MNAIARPIDYRVRVGLENHSGLPNSMRPFESHNPTQKNSTATTLGDHPGTTHNHRPQRKGMIGRRSECLFKDGRGSMGLVLRSTN